MNLLIILSLFTFASGWADEKPMGCKLTQIQKDSIYEKLGLKEGDEIMAINGKSCDSPQDILLLFKPPEKLKKMKIKVRRKGRTETLVYDIQ